MAEAVVTCLELSKPQPLLLASYVVRPDADLRALSSQRSLLQTALRDIGITGECESVLKQAHSYARAWSIYWSHPSKARSVSTLKPLQFEWSPFFREQQEQFSSSSAVRSEDLEASTCVWFELAMTLVVCGQLYYSLGVEQLEEYKQSAAKDNVCRAALYFQNGAHLFLEAEHQVRDRWITTELDFDPVIRDSRTTQIWVKLCLAAAQHCYSLRFQVCSPNSLEGLSKLLMAEAQLYSEVLQLMQQLGMIKPLRQLYHQVGCLFVESLTGAYTSCLRSVATSEENVCKKEAALLQVRSALKKQLPSFSLEQLEKELEQIHTQRVKVYFLQLKDNEAVPRTMKPIPHLTSKALAPEL